MVLHVSREYDGFIASRHGRRRPGNRVGVHARRGPQARWRAPPGRRFPSAISTSEKRGSQRRSSSQSRAPEDAVRESLGPVPGRRAVLVQARFDVVQVEHRAPGNRGDLRAIRRAPEMLDHRRCRSAGLQGALDFALEARETVHQRRHSARDAPGVAPGPHRHAAVVRGQIDRSDAADQANGHACRRIAARPGWRNTIRSTAARAPGSERSDAVRSAPPPASG